MDRFDIALVAHSNARYITSDTSRPNSCCKVTSLDFSCSCSDVVFVVKITTPGNVVKTGGGDGTAAVSGGNFCVRACVSACARVCVCVRCRDTFFCLLVVSICSSQ